MEKKKKQKELQAEKDLAKKGVNTSGVGKMYRAFKSYINFPTFDQSLNGDNPYSEFQYNTLRNYLFDSTNPSLVQNGIKDAISYLNAEGFSEYTWDDFGTFAVKYWKQKEYEVITDQNFLITNYRDNVEQFHRVQPFFYDKAKMYWMWNHNAFCYELVDETDILITIDSKLSFGGQLVTSKIKGNYLEAFKQVGRMRIPKLPDKSWIQFKDKVYDLKTKTIFDCSPEYFMCNPIPHKIGKSQRTPIIDKMFEEWVGPENKQLLYEIIAYCCLSDYPIHRLFCLVGSGRNGKSQYQKVVQRFIGNTNVSSTELDLLIDNRFESAKLFKKLVCTLGETNFGIMSKTSLLKKLTGGDLIGYEFKNKNPFDDYNYAKIIINSNALPSSLDTSDGFYRRWLIIDFPNEFEEGKDIVETIPIEEYNNLARKVCLILPKLLASGKFTAEGTIEERKLKFIQCSNPFSLFLKEKCQITDESYIKTNELFNKYIKYLRINKKRKLNRKEFSEILAEEGLFSEKTSKLCAKKGDWVSTFWVSGVELKKV